MDFAALPPEINSSRLYTGPGTGPMLAAATAWDQLATELHSSAAAYSAVIAALATDGWQGPSSQSMTNAITPYLTWMHNTAAHAEETAAQAKTAAGAYQTAFAAVVPPALISANRAQVAALIAGNFFGQNSPAIALTEAEYERMWAQDATAMYGYAGASASASTMMPFQDPPQTISGGAAGIAAPLTAAAPAAADPTSLMTYLLQIPSITSAAASTTSSSFSGASMQTTNHALAINAIRDDAQGIGPFLASAPAAPSGIAAPAASAALGRASLVGTLSVPQSWAATATPAASAAAAPAATVVPAALETVPGQGVVGEALLGTLAGRGVSNAAARLRRPSVIPRSPAAG